MLTLARTAGGRTLSRYSVGCAANNSHDGIDTTRLRTYAVTVFAILAACSSDSTYVSPPIQTIDGTWATDTTAAPNLQFTLAYDSTKTINVTGTGTLRLSLPGVDPMPVTVGGGFIPSFGGLDISVFSDGSEYNIIATVTGKTMRGTIELNSQLGRALGPDTLTMTRR